MSMYFLFAVLFPTAINNSVQEISFVNRSNFSESRERMMLILEYNNLDLVFQVNESPPLL